mgnify:CR=1 FL=1
MTSWNVTGGQWSMTRTVGGEGNGTPADSAVTLERSASVRVSFAPHAMTSYEFRLVKPSGDVADRPDLGVGRDDVALKGRSVTVAVHSLGARAANGGTAALVARDGRVLATVRVPDLAAPTDLLPKIATVRMTLPAGVAPSEVSVRVALTGDAAEVTGLNNSVPLVAPRP